MEIEIGIMNESDGRVFFKDLNGQTYMNFRVYLGRVPGGVLVTLATDYKDTPDEVLAMALYVIAAKGRPTLTDNN